MDPNKEKLRSGYDSLADEYARRYYNELAHKPKDRSLLRRLYEAVDDLGPICDIGCGPGQIARYLHDLGAECVGVDLSKKMVATARRLNPDIRFIQGSMLTLDFEDAVFGGIAAFYSIIHIPHEKVVAALVELKRVLKPGGRLLLAFHIGNETLHVEELWETAVDLDFIFFPVKEMERYLVQAGYDDLETVERAPYPEIEYQSRRAYIFAANPK
jgi:SAM-dependent methyltransferase